MKYGLVSGLILVVALAASLHRTAPAPEFPGRRVRPARESSAPTPGLSASGTAREFQAQDAAILPEAPVERTPPAPAKKPDEAPSWTRIRPLLERDLGLTPLQQERVSQALLDREKEVQDLHDAILKSGVVDIRDYDWQTARMKETWYRRIDGLLDTEQHVRFVALVERGLLNEGLAFTIEPGMTVLE